jgi:hypothetical protein
MTIKTSKDPIPSLRGSAFRTIVCDGRHWSVRAIKTLRTLYMHPRLTAASEWQTRASGAYLGCPPGAKTPQIQPYVGSYR